MRLINVHTLAFEEYYNNIPQYAILSHTWEDDEVSFADWKDLASARQKKGFRKIKLACNQAKEDGIDYVWVDTNCIDKSSSADLTEAINSMFQWYQGAEVCYVFLQDLSVAGYEAEAEEHEFRKNKRARLSRYRRKPPPPMPPSLSTLLPVFEETPTVRKIVPKYLDITQIRQKFEKCKWFTRGWTLQALLAPKTVMFYSSEWTPVGRKDAAISLLSSITGIDEKYISNKSSVHEAPIGERMSWMASRKTARAEDLAYCLLGLFQINMPLLYGEGRHAFIRLQEEIIRVSNDQTIFCWERDLALQDFNEHNLMTWKGMLAPFPAAFRNSARFRARAWSQSLTRPFLVPSMYTVVNAGLDITLPVMYMGHFICVILDAVAPIGHSSSDPVVDHSSGMNGEVILFLRRDESGSYLRVYDRPIVTKLPKPLKIFRARIFIKCSSDAFFWARRRLSRHQLQVPTHVQLLLMFDRHAALDDYCLQETPSTSFKRIFCNTEWNNDLNILPVPLGSTSQFVVSGTCLMPGIGKFNNGGDDYSSQSFSIIVRTQLRHNFSAGDDTGTTPPALPIDVDIFNIKNSAAFTEVNESAASSPLYKWPIPELGGEIDTQLWHLFPGSEIVVCLVKTGGIATA